MKIYFAGLPAMSLNDEVTREREVFIYTIWSNTKVD